MILVRRFNTLPWWKDIAEKYVSPGQILYKNNHFINPPHKVRGDTITTFLRRKYEESIGITSYPLVKHVNGHTPYDFHDLQNNLRVEVKSSRFYWNKRSRSWILAFQNVKMDNFDTL